MVQSWFDNTGLYQKFGIDQATPKRGGEYRNNGQLREIELKINLVDLTTTDIIQDDNLFFPAGMMIQEVVVEVTTAATSGGSATLDIGLMRTDRSTITDADGFVAQLALASINAAGKQVILNVGSTSAGSSIGLVTANVNQITAKYNTAVFTAGTIVVKIRYYKP